MVGKEDRWRKGTVRAGSMPAGGVGERVPEDSASEILTHAQMLALDERWDLHVLSSRTHDVDGWKTSLSEVRRTRECVVGSHLHKRGYTETGGRIEDAGGLGRREQSRCFIRCLS